jgi:hypothetical protein
MSGTTFLDRLRAMEARIRALEASQGSGLSGTDQTIKGSHDRLDSMLGAGGTLSVADCGQQQLLVRKNVTDDTATPVFTVTTANETNDNDAGHWAAYVHAICSNGAHVVSSTAASNKGFLGVVTRAQECTGTGVCSVVTEAVETASAATNAANRDVTTVTMSITETSEYVTTVEFLVKGTGGLGRGVSMYVTAFVILVWTTFTTPPVLAAA